MFNFAQWNLGPDRIPGEKNSTNLQKQHNNGLKRNVTLTEILLSLTSGVFNF